jgi:hypothetical protein
MEEYFSMVQQVRISHGCCPECYTRQISEIAGKDISPSL